MKIFDLNLSPSPFSKIKRGLKEIEMRLATPARKEIKIGDHIRFTRNDTGESISVEVISLKEFPSFKELYEFYPKNKLGYLDKEEANYKDMYQYYSIEDISKYGVLAIGIKNLE